MEFPTLAGDIFPVRVLLRVKRSINFKLALNISGDLSFQSKFDPHFFRQKLIK